MKVFVGLYKLYTVISLRFHTILIIIQRFIASLIFRDNVCISEIIEVQNSKQYMLPTSQPSAQCPIIIQV